MEFQVFFWFRNFFSCSTFCQGEKAISSGNIFAKLFSFIWGKLVLCFSLMKLSDYFCFHPFRLFCFIAEKPCLVDLGISWDCKIVRRRLDRSNRERFKNQLITRNSLKKSVTENEDEEGECHVLHKINITWRLTTETTWCRKKMVCAFKGQEISRLFWKDDKVSERRENTKIHFSPLFVSDKSRHIFGVNGAEKNSIV